MDSDPHYLQHLAPGFDRDEVLRDLMVTYGEDVWKFAYFLTRRSDLADDIAQDVFLIAYTRLYAFRRDCSVKSWLLTITRNKSLNYMKSSFIRKVTLLGVLFPGQQAPSAEQVLFDRLESRELWTQVMKLPRKFREVLILSYHYGLSVKEIAGMLQVSEGTVKSRANRAKNKLAEYMDDARKGD
ncbi:RNA polymerase sigma factor [Paenibacillus sp. HJGM_3]|uniref:RNA polymerase sigma factor n=1 Tax=Paenibacillus sp. HJGM_3 TaxID=3379816 RepID=UPI00385AAF4B